MGLAALLTVSVYSYPGVPGNRSQNASGIGADLGRLVTWVEGRDRYSAGQPGQTPRISPESRPVATQPATTCYGCGRASQHGSEEEGARMRSNERGLSDADQSSGKKRPNSAMDSTDGAEEPGGAMADIKRADHEVLLSRKMCIRDRIVVAGARH